MKNGKRRGRTEIKNEKWKMKKGKEGWKLKMKNEK